MSLSFVVPGEAGINYRLTVSPSCSKAPGQPCSRFSAQLRNTWGIRWLAYLAGPCRVSLIFLCWVGCGRYPPRSGFWRPQFSSGEG